MRLYDRLRLAGGTWPEIPVIIADNILKQIDDMPDNRQSPWDIGETPSAASYGCVAPPFEQFFVEANATFDGETIQRGGFCFQIEPRPEIAPPSTRWCLVITPWFYMHGEVVSCQASALIHIDVNGSILDDMQRIQVAETARPHPSLLPSSQAAHNVPFILRAIAAMHRRAEAEKITPSRQQRRQFQRKFQTDLSPTDYWILKVKTHVPQSYEEIGEPAIHHGAPREHSVRGHFRWYGERGMFGREEMTNRMVWIPNHERGEDTIGAIRKDYEIN
jgi:hypothetical protein